MTARYRSRLKMRVTLTLMPRAMDVVMAGRPASVAGILMNRLGRSTSHHRCAASAAVAGEVVEPAGAPGRRQLGQLLVLCHLNCPSRGGVIAPAAGSRREP